MSPQCQPSEWERIFSRWAQPPGSTEQQRCENAEGAIRNALARSPKLQQRSVKVFAQGSYRNRVNVRQDSDVDIGILCNDSFLDRYPTGTTREMFGNVPATYQYSQFKNEVEEALVSYFGRAAVRRGNKAFDIRENSYHVEADVAPFFEHRHYYPDRTWLCGVGLIPDNGGRIVNYPERLLDTWPARPQHYENGVAKNHATQRAFKGAVRILKSLRNEMDEEGSRSASAIPGFLIECLVWNAPDLAFGRSTWDDLIQGVLSHLWSGLREEHAIDAWLEVNAIRYLFHPAQKWSRSQAFSFVDAAWSYVGVR